ncbi:hypothetical protein ACFX13_006586 [Malus domestica]|uniref:Uncharacterized protein n=1 Tax=Malus domestica TaxID=3750 RepID=A0A498IKH5_MALDO|nr:hypothetical protein DVH24_005933 [Malus domestica]
MGQKAQFLIKRPVVGASAPLRIERSGTTAMTVCMGIFHEASVMDDIARAKGNAFSLAKQVASPLSVQTPVRPEKASGCRSSQEDGAQGRYEDHRDGQRVLG